MEYTEAHNMIRHFDKQKWEIGAILITGNLISIAIVASNIQSYSVLSIFFILLWSTLIYSLWMAWFLRNSGLIYILYTRTEEIETKLGIKMERCIRNKHPSYSKERTFDICKEEKPCKKLLPISAKLLLPIYLILITVAWISLILLRLYS